MQEQMEQQFEQWQHGLTSAIENGSKLAEPMLRTNEVMLDSFSRLVKDQFEFGQSCMDIGRRQMESMAKHQDFTVLFGDQGAAADYYAAVRKYGEAVRDNAESTHERMVAIGREMTDTVAGGASQETQARAPVAAGAAEEAPAAKAGNTGGKESAKAAAKPAAKAAKKAPAKSAAKPTAKAPAADKAAATDTPETGAAAETSENVPATAADKTDKAADEAKAAPAKAKADTGDKTSPKSGSQASKTSRKTAAKPSRKA